MKSHLITYGWALKSFNNGVSCISFCCGIPQTRKSAYFSTVDMLVVASFRVGNVRNGTKQLNPPYEIASHNLWLGPWNHSPAAFIAFRTVVAPLGHERARFSV